MAKSKKPTKRALIKKLDTVFSLYIRHKYAREGVVRCYTCDVVKPISQMQCGHFISRAVYTTRWDENNTKPQCVSCNMFHAGRQYEFGERLKEELGADVFDAMWASRHSLSNFTVSDYQDKIEYYTRQLSSLEA